MLPTWMYATGRDCAVREPVRRQHGHGGQRGGHEGRDRADDRLSLERQGVDHGPARGQSRSLRDQDPRARPQRQPALYGHAALRRASYRWPSTAERLTPAIERGYAVIERRWKAGDKIELELPMPVQRVKAVTRAARRSAEAVTAHSPGPDQARPIRGPRCRSARSRDPRNYQKEFCKIIQS